MTDKSADSSSDEQMEERVKGLVKKALSEWVDERTAENDPPKRTEKPATDVWGSLFGASK